MRGQNSVYNWIEASFTQCDRWDLGSEKGHCFWNYFHRICEIVRDKSSTVYTLPQLFSSLFSPLFFFSFPLF
jgi:hypothetical protein